MIPFPAKVVYYKTSPEGEIGKTQAVHESAVVLECVSRANGEQWVICVTASGRCVALPLANVTPVISAEWRKMMAEVELSAVGDEKP